MDVLENKYKTDKCNWCHNYTKKYDELFKDIRFKKLKILEIGIGSAPMPSLRLWKEYFPNSQIYGIDIEETYINNNVENITTFLFTKKAHYSPSFRVSNILPDWILVTHSLELKMLTKSRLFRLEILA